ncbi:hypothetical protein Tco_0566441 [Tanacetum coccineum]
METQKPLLKDEDGKEVDVHLYKSMIGSLMYLTSSRPDIMFTVCACARYQVNPKVLNLHVVKRIFRYLKGQPKLGLWYPKDSPFDLVAYTDSDYAGTSLDRKSTTGGCQFLRCRLISRQCKKLTVVANSTTEAEYVVASSCCGQVLWIQNQLLNYGYNFLHTKIFIDNNINAARHKLAAAWGKLMLLGINLLLLLKVNAARHNLQLLVNVKTVNGKVQLQALVDGKKIIVTKASVRRDLQLNNEEGTDCLPNASIFEELTRMGYEKLSQKLTFYKAFFCPQWKFLIHTILQCLRAKTTAWNEFSSTMASAIIYETVYEERDDSLVKAATTASSLEAEQDSGNIDKIRSKATLNEPSFLGTSSCSGPRCQDTMGDTIARTRFENVSKISNDSLIAGGRHGDEDMFGVNDLDCDEVVVESEPVVVTNVASTILVSAATITNVELTLAQSLAELTSTRPKAKGLVKGQGLKDKGKAKMIELEKPLKKKDQIKLAREKAQQVEEANIAWDDIQPKIDVDYQLAERLQTQEQQKLTIEEKSTLFVQLLEKRKKHFAAKRAEEQRNRPPTRAQ